MGGGGVNRSQAKIYVKHGKTSKKGGGSLSSYPFMGKSEAYTLGKAPDSGKFSAIFLQITPGTKLPITVSRNSAPVRRYSRASSNFHFSRGNFGVRPRPPKNVFFDHFLAFNSVQRSI